MNLLDYISLGGVVGWVLTGMVFVCLVLIIERCIYFLTTSASNEKLPHPQKKKTSQVQRLRNRSLELSNEPKETTLEELERLGSQLCHEMEQGLWLLEFISAVAPSLGLLGTVIGLIKSFQGMGSGMDIQNFSGGIWEAMLTTAFGLIVAIPSLFFANYFRRIVEVRTLHMSLVAPVKESTEDKNNSMDKDNFQGKERA